MDGCGARHSAIDSGAELSAAGGAGHGGADSQAPNGHRNGGDPADLHGAGLESRLQLLFVAQEHSEGDGGGYANLSLLGLAAVLATGDAERGNRAGVEFDRFGCWRVVRSHFLRDVYDGRAELPAAGAGELYPDGYLCRRCAGAFERHCGGDPDRSCRRSACLAAADCVERQIQI